MSRTTVGILGASGETGNSIVNGLLEANTFVRPMPIDPTHNPFD